eukprot:1158365-Pelagomonas_calceolata.AAC.15
MSHIWEGALSHFIVVIAESLQNQVCEDWPTFRWGRPTSDFKRAEAAGKCQKNQLLMKFAKARVVASAAASQGDTHPGRHTHTGCSWIPSKDRLPMECGRAKVAAAAKKVAERAQVVVTAAGGKRQRGSRQRLSRAWSKYG